MVEEHAQHQQYVDVHALLNVVELLNPEDATKVWLPCLCKVEEVSIAALGNAKIEECQRRDQRRQAAEHKGNEHVVACPRTAATHAVVVLIFWLAHFLGLLLLVERAEDHELRPVPDSCEVKPQEPPLNRHVPQVEVGGLRQIRGQGLKHHRRAAALPREHQVHPAPAQCGHDDSEEDHEPIVVALELVLSPSMRRQLEAIDEDDHEDRGQQAHPNGQAQ
mmetsp:Transcript_77064/g.178759  ORF Transcript_77064/g.178759 Transcript_77064/m.178759 type:complete len:220 (-) Transcript_77064:516-1175(-)